MGLLNKFQDKDRNALTKSYVDLCASIQESFEGTRGRWDGAERFKLILNGLTEVYVHLNIQQRTISVTVNGSISMSHDNRYIVEAVKDTKKKALALKKVVAKYIKLESKWHMSMQSYGHVAFSTEVSTELSESFLSDLVKLMECAGYVPRQRGVANYF